MTADPRSTGSRALRASARLTVLAVALLICGGAVEVAGALLGPSANGGGGSPHPTTTVQPTSPLPSSSEAQPPSDPPPDPTTPLPEPTATATVREFPPSHRPTGTRTPAKPGAAG